MRVSGCLPGARVIPRGQMQEENRCIANLSLYSRFLNMCLYLPLVIEPFAFFTSMHETWCDLRYWVTRMWYFCTCTFLTTLWVSNVSHFAPPWLLVNFPIFFKTLMDPWGFLFYADFLRPLPIFILGFCQFCIVLRSFSTL